MSFSSVPRSQVYPLAVRAVPERRFASGLETQQNSHGKLWVKANRSQLIRLRIAWRLKRSKG